VLKKAMYGYRFTQDKMLPRQMWVNKEWTLKELHLRVFDYFRQVMVEWIAHNEAAAVKTGADTFVNVCDFPY
jgi:hypothetical protein